MATHSNLSPDEQKEARNKRRREIYSSKTSEGMTPLERRVNRRKEQFIHRAETLQDWRKTDTIPWPSLAKRIQVTRLWYQITGKVGLVCYNCQTTQVLPSMWRITRVDDFLAFVPFQKEAYERVLQRPQEFAIYCPCCTFDLRISAFASIFSPYDRGITGATDIFRSMYPRGPKLIEYINQGRIRSLTCDNGLLRKNPYHDYVGSVPAPIVQIEIPGVTPLNLPEAPIG